jgi:predicted lipase
MTNSVFLDEGEQWLIPRNRSELIKEAVLAAGAAYNDEALVALRSRTTRTQLGNLQREEIAKTQEVISFSASVPGYGNMPAGIVTYKEDESGQGQITVAYHGTESYADLITDVQSWKQENKILGLEGAIHGGFNELYMQNRESLIALIEAVCEAHGKEVKDIKFLVTGHSLGGALSTIAAFDIKNNIAKDARIDLITFCSPRVFDAKGAAHFEKLMENRAIRIWRDNDIVPMVSPGTGFLGPFTGFKHVGQAEKLEARFEGYLPSIGNHELSHIRDDAFSSKEVKTSQHEGSWDWAGRKLSNMTNGAAKGLSWMRSWF